MSTNAQFSCCAWHFHPIQTAIMQKPSPPPASLGEYPVSTSFISLSDGRWPTLKSLYVPWFKNENCQVQGLSHWGLIGLSLNWFSPDSRLLPVHVGCKPKSFAKPGGWSCVFLGADILFSTDRGKHGKSLRCLNPEGIIWAKDFNYNWQCRRPADGSHFTDVALSLVTLAVRNSCQLTHICR